MKKILVTLALVTVATSAFAQGTAQTFQENVTVSGSGRVTVSPDRFSFSVGVQTVAPTVEAAVNENNQRVASVIAALKRAGATDKDIQTSNFSIWPQQDYSQGKLPRILGYQVSNNVTVRRSEIGEAGRLLQVAVNAGVNTTSGLAFEVSDPAKGRDAGMRAAFEDARAKAALLAAAAGRTLGRALSISESGAGYVPPPHPMPRAVSMEAKAAVSDIPVEPGAQENNYSVTVVFELR